MHILSSTATFTLSSPLPLSITSISAEAYHNGTKIAQIDYDYPFDVPKGVSESPKLPVQWELDEFGTVKEALGGGLKVDAEAVVGVQVGGQGGWRERVWFTGGGIGARVRL